MSCEYRSLSILLRWSATGRNDGFENVTFLKCESRTRTQSRIRSQIWRSLINTRVIRIRKLAFAMPIPNFLPVLSQQRQKSYPAVPPGFPFWQNCQRSLLYSQWFFWFILSTVYKNSNGTTLQEATDCHHTLLLKHFFGCFGILPFWQTIR